MYGKSIANALVIAGLLLAWQSTGSPISNSASRINRSVTRPVPSAPPPATRRSDRIWVPDRLVGSPTGNGVIHVPGHWERRISEREFYVPPLPGCNVASGACVTAPAGVRTERPENRLAP